MYKETASPLVINAVSLHSRSSLSFAKMATLSTPFGSFKGKHADGVVQFLGIPYATLKDQLSLPEMVTSYDSMIDATEYG